MNHRYRKRILAASIIASLSLSAATQAQDTSADDEASELDVIVVTGIRGSLKESLNTKREADAIVDAITAEDVGKFPSTNVAEAMTIIPGVTIDRLFGQGERISILGTDPALNRTLLNGQTVASADWFILDQPGRTFNYTLLAPQIVGKVEVFKSPEPRIDEGSIGGTVIVSTRKPLDMDADRMISGSVGYLYNDRSKESDPQGSVAFGWKNDAETFGFTISAQTSSENIRRDGLEAYGTVSAQDYRDGQGGGGSINNPPMNWATGVPFPPSCTGACADEINANLTARGPNSWGTSFFEQERERDSYTASLQFRPNDNLDIEFNALRVDASYNNTNQSLFAFMGNAWNSLMRLDDVDIENGIIQRAHFTNALSVLDVQYREAEVTTDSYDLKGTWTDDNWFLSAHVGTTKADGGTQRQLFGEFLNWASYTYDISGAPGNPGTITYDNGNVLGNPDAFRVDGGWGSDPSGPSTWNTGWGGNLVSKPNEDSEDYGQIDFGFDLDSVVNRLQFGYKLRRHKTAQVMSGVAVAAVAGYGDALASMFNAGRVPDNYLDGFSGANDQMRNRFIIDGDAMAAWIASGAWLAPWQTMPVPGTFIDPSFVAETWSVKEDTDAFYAQADFATDRLRGNFGFRYVQTETTSDSWTCTAGISPCPVNDYAPVSQKRDYDNILPTFNIAFDANDDLVLRFAAAKVIARPNYSDLSSYLWLSDQILNGGGGNPDLDPYQSTNFDASAEWYFADDAIFAASVFYKDISDYILVTTAPETHYNQAQQTDTVYQIGRPQNAGSAEIKGYSLAYQQNFGAGFGIVANYTYADGSASTGADLPYNSRDQVNISPFYENYNFSARLNYGWRSEYFTSVDRGDRMYADEYTSLDATIGYRFSDRWSISLDGMNLLDSEYYTYANVPELPRGTYRSGRRYMSTLRFQF